MNNTLDFYGVKCKNVRFEIAVGTRERTHRGGEPIQETVYDKFSLCTPYAYKMRELRERIRTAIKPILNGTRKFVEMTLIRWPQVWTVMGEINAELPKSKRLSFSYTSKDEENTLFIISSK